MLHYALFSLPISLLLHSPRPIVCLSSLFAPCFVFFAHRIVLSSLLIALFRLLCSSHCFVSADSAGFRDSMLAEIGKESNCENRLAKVCPSRAFVMRIGGQNISIYLRNKAIAAFGYYGKHLPQNSILHLEPKSYSHMMEGSLETLSDEIRNKMK